MYPRISNPWAISAGVPPPATTWRLPPRLRPRPDAASAGEEEQTSLEDAPFDIQNRRHYELRRADLRAAHADRTAVLTGWWDSCTAEQEVAEVDFERLRTRIAELSRPVTAEDLDSPGPGELGDPSNTRVWRQQRRNQKEAQKLLKELPAVERRALRLAQQSARWSRRIDREIERTARAEDVVRAVANRRAARYVRIFARRRASITGQPVTVAPLPPLT